MSHQSAVLKQHVTDCVETVLRWSSESNKLLNKSEIISWLRTAPPCTTFRVNTLVTNVNEMLIYISDYMTKRAGIIKAKVPKVYLHSALPDCIVIEPWDINELDLTPKDKEVIVHVTCGTSVLRGSNIYAKGVVGMFTGIKLGDEVSVYADLTRMCKKGFKKKFLGDKVFVGNGIVHMMRHQLFTGDKNIQGLAVEMTNPVSGISLFPVPTGSGIIQNSPSILCSHVLDVKPGMTVLDACAAPGNKTTHLAALLKNQGLIVAIDKNKNKIPVMLKDCSDMSVTCVRCFIYDSTKLSKNIDESPGMENKSAYDGPPFKPNTFDRILLDASCSGFGQRPLLFTLIENNRRLESYPVLQRQMFYETIPLLKPGGILVYSTCSILCEENELNVKWVLDTFADIELVPSEPVLGGSGLPNCGLSEEQRTFVQRFGPGAPEDSIGFFMAKFCKKEK